MIDTLSQLLESFQQCRRRGESAQLFLETRNGQQFARFSVQLFPANFCYRAKPQDEVMKKRKSPSQMRRDQSRLRKLREKRLSQKTALTPTSARTSTPTSTPNDMNDMDETNQAFDKNDSTDNEMNDMDETNHIFTDDKNHSTDNDMNDMDETNQDFTDDNPDETFICHEESIEPEAIKPPIRKLPLTSTEMEDLADKISSAISKRTSIETNRPSLLETFNAMCKDHPKTLNQQFKSLENKNDDATHEIKTNIYNDSEDNKFEEAAIWARNQKKDYI